VVVDGRLVGYLVGTRPKAFVVEPGEHVVRVYLDRHAKRSESISVGPKGGAVLVCGFREEWRGFWDEERRRAARLLRGVWLAGLAGWFLWPVLREAVAWFALQLDLPPLLLSLVYRPVRSRAPTSLWAMGSILFPGEFTNWVRTGRIARRLRIQVGEPCYLKQASSDDVRT
jgi:hypothetical protein